MTSAVEEISTLSSSMLGATESVSLRSASTTLTGSSHSQSGVTSIKFSIKGSVASNGENSEEDTAGYLDDTL
jgi:hypothetical protein